MPSLAPVKVAIIDSGIDGSHPDLAGRVVAAKSFVGGSPYHDEQGHGTFVAGEIAANPTNGIGMAGLAFNARLIVAKVVAADGEVSLPAEVAGIRWAVDQGARVINLSLGGVRDPLNPSLDTYSPLERAAVEYAYSKGAVVVAAVGNGTQSPSTPWRYAAYPAALPHVIGVSAVRRDGSVPDYSNRDAVYVDVAAPGDDMFSTIPSNLVADDSGCTDPYSDCGPFELRDAIGTSFAAPQVSAAAALLLGVDPSLTPDQVGVHHRAERRRRVDDLRLRCVRDRPRRVDGLGDARRRKRARAAHLDAAAAAARPVRAERRRRRRGRTRFPRASMRSTRRSTTGTTTSTSTACASSPGSGCSRA